MNLLHKNGKKKKPLSKKRIVLLDGHPAQESLSKALTLRYANYARKGGHEVRIHHLSEYDFDMDFEFSKYSDAKTLEPDLEQFIADLKWANHFFLCTPMWWGGLPAKLKGLIDRSFLPGSVFDTRVKKGKMPKPMLKDITGRIIITSDTPGWIMNLMYRNALINQLKGQVLGFIGITPTKITWCAGAGSADKKKIDQWLGEIEKLGYSAT